MVCKVGGEGARGGEVGYTGINEAINPCLREELVAMGRRWNYAGRYSSVHGQKVSMPFGSLPAMSGT